MRQFILVALAVTLLPACSGYFRDRSLDYGQAKPSPALVMPAGVETRPIKPLYPIPAVAETASASGKNFVVPFPPAMKPVQEVSLPPLPNSPGRTPVKLGTDGNGVPELRVVGPRERVWDELGRALNNAGVSLKDRNQELGLVDLSIAGQDYQLRMVRATEAFVLSLQRNDETLAPVAVSRNLLTTLQARWP
jgi:outer membrane protein assembly factor BamC